MTNDNVHPFKASSSSVVQGNSGSVPTSAIPPETKQLRHKTEKTSDGGGWSSFFTEERIVIGIIFTWLIALTSTYYFEAKEIRQTMSNNHLEVIKEIKDSEKSIISSMHDQRREIEGKIQQVGSDNSDELKEIQSGVKKNSDRIYELNQRP